MHRATAHTISLLLALAACTPPAVKPVTVANPNATPSDAWTDSAAIDAPASATPGDLAAAAELAVAPVLYAYCKLWPTCELLVHSTDAAGCLADPHLLDVTWFVYEGLAAIRTGHAHLDASQVGPCAQAIASPDCRYAFWMSHPLPEPCRKLFTGTLPDGEHCFSPYECASAGCVALPGEATTCRVCGPGAAVGSACEHYWDCQSGLECPEVTHTCVPGSDIVLGSACVDRFDCQPGQLCAALDASGNPTGNGPKVCIAARTLGQSCDDEEGLYCAPELRCDANKHCVARVPVGAACSFDVPYYAECVPGAWCVPEPPAMKTGTCQPIGAIGQPCFVKRGCLNRDLVCAPQPDGVPRCIKGPWVGMACTPNKNARYGYDVSDCSPTLRCDSSTLQCVPLPGLGEPCPAGLCRDDLVCVLTSSDTTSGICRATSGYGEECTTWQTEWGERDSCAFVFECSKVTGRCDVAGCP